MEILGDTSFFIDLQRRKVVATGWLAANPSARIRVSAVVYGELLVGLSEPDVLALIGGERPIPPDVRAARVWSQTNRELRASGTIIGQNDLWIAASALVRGIPVLTRNVGEFGRVPGLRVEGYG